MIRGYTLSIRSRSLRSLFVNGASIFWNNTARNLDIYTFNVSALTMISRRVFEYNDISYRETPGESKFIISNSDVSSSTNLSICTSFHQVYLVYRYFSGT